MRFVKARLEANDGCNTLETSVAVDAHTVTKTGDVRTTMAGCDQSPLRDAYDRELFDKSFGWTVSSGRLTLTTINGDTFEFRPSTAGYPSDLAGVKHSTTAAKAIDGVRFRIYAQARGAGGDQCLTMEFDSPAGAPWEPIGACRDNLAVQYGSSPVGWCMRMVTGDPVG